MKNSFSRHSIFKRHHVFQANVVLRFLVSCRRSVRTTASRYLFSRRRRTLLVVPTRWTRTRLLNFATKLLALERTRFTRVPNRHRRCQPLQRPLEQISIWDESVRRLFLNWSVFQLSLSFAITYTAIFIPRNYDASVNGCQLRYPRLPAYRIRFMSDS